MGKETAFKYGDSQERYKLYKRFGYDIDRERHFVIEQTAPFKGSILEIGTGKGNFALALAQRGYRFISVDISQEEQALARALIRGSGLAEQVDFQIQDAEKLNFEDACFDNVFSVNLMHHLENPFAVIEEMTRVTKLQGRIIISDFTDHGFEVIKKIHQFQGNDHHKGAIEFGDIKAYLRDKGFCIQECIGEIQQVIMATHKIIS